MIWDQDGHYIDQWTPVRAAERRVHRPHRHDLRGRLGILGARQPGLEEKASASAAQRPGRFTTFWKTSSRGTSRTAAPRRSVSIRSATSTAASFAGSMLERHEARKRRSRPAARRGHVEKLRRGRAVFAAWSIRTQETPMPNDMTRRERTPGRCRGPEPDGPADLGPAGPGAGTRVWYRSPTIRMIGKPNAVRQRRWLDIRTIDGPITPTRSTLMRQKFRPLAPGRARCG